MNLVRLIEVDRGVPVYVNPDYVTFIQQAMGRKGSLVGLVGDDLGCEVEGSPDRVAAMVCPGLGTQTTNADSTADTAGAERREIARKPRKPYKHHRDKPREDKCNTGESREQTGA